MSGINGIGLSLSVIRWDTYLIQSNMPIEIGTTEDDNGAMSAPVLSIIPAESGTQRLIGLDSRLRGNDMGGRVRPDISGLYFSGNDAGLS